jgi:hypothetical protein
MVIKPKIINSVHSSRESLKTHHSRTIDIRRPSLEQAIEETELISLNATNRHMTPSGKRKDATPVPRPRKGIIT